MAGTSSGQYYEFRSDTPESSRARRKLIDSMLEQAGSYQPIGHWAGVIAKALQGIAGGSMLHDLEQQEKADRAAGASEVDRLYGGANTGRAPVGGPAGTPDTMPPEVPAGDRPKPQVPQAPSVAAPAAGTPAETAAGAPRAYGMPDYERAIGTIESGGDYNKLGPVFTNKRLNVADRALGKYQVLQSNLPEWSKQVLGREMSPQEFLASPEAQDAIFRAKFGAALNTHGNPEDAASVWFSGRPRKAAGNDRDILGTTVPGYVDKFTQALALNAPPSPAAGPQSPPMGAPAAGVPAAPVAPTSALPTPGGGAATPAAGTPMPPGAPPQMAPGGAPPTPTAPAVMAEGAVRSPDMGPIQPYLNAAARRNPDLAAMAASRVAPAAYVHQAQELLAKEAQELREKYVIGENGQFSPRPLTREEMTARTESQAKAAAAVYGAEKERREVNKTRTGPETAAAVQGIIGQARQLPVDFGKDAFERATGTYIQGKPGPFWENLTGSIMRPVAQGVAELTSAVMGGARPGEVQDAVKGIQANLVAILGPSVRAPGAQSNYELEQIEAQAGALGGATSVEDYTRRLNRLEKSVEIFLTRNADPVKILHMSAGPRSADAPREAASVPVVEAGLRNAASALLPEFLGGAPAAPAAPAASPAYDINRTRKASRLRDVMMGAAQ